MSVVRFASVPQTPLALGDQVTVEVDGEHRDGVVVALYCDHVEEPQVERVKVRLDAGKVVEALLVHPSDAATESRSDLEVRTDAASQDAQPADEATTDLTAAEKRDFWQAVCEWNDVPDAFSRDSDSNAILFAAVERIAAERVATALHSAANEAQAPLHVEAWLHARAEAERRGEPS